VSDEPEDRARQMRMLPERDRNVLIALGVLQRNVIDARCRFDRDRLSVTLADLMAPTITINEFGPYFPGDCA
jgi:hypothetical protein